ncbi:Uncharacterised protein [Vibrio cholerae]|nr:Uncharacterised protein [Vibrio cholerae]
MVHDLIDTQIATADTNVHFIHAIDVKALERIRLGVLEIGTDFRQFDFENFPSRFEIFFTALFAEPSINLSARTP